MSEENAAVTPIEDEAPKYNPNDLANYTALVVDFKRRFNRRPKPLRKPYVLWGRYIFEIQTDKSTKVKASLKEMPVTISTGQADKLDTMYRRGWRVLDYWIPDASELPPIQKDQLLYGWRYQYFTDPEEFVSIRQRVNSHKANGQGLHVAMELKTENKSLQEKVVELTRKLEAAERKDVGAKRNG